MSSSSRRRKRMPSDEELLQRATQPMAPGDALLALALIAVLGVGLVLVLQGVF